LLELAVVMTDTSICGLGQAASMAILNALGHWPEIFQKTTDGGRQAPKDV
jgi:NADH:ubiquinone oxidoreductase subunit F (NADH-binding)